MIWYRDPVSADIYQTLWWPIIGTDTDVCFRATCLWVNGVWTIALGHSKPWVGIQWIDVAIGGNFWECIRLVPTDGAEIAQFAKEVLEGHNDSVS